MENYVPEKEEMQDAKLLGVKVECLVCNMKIFVMIAEGESMEGRKQAITAGRIDRGRRFFSSRILTTEHRKRRWRRQRAPLGFPLSAADRNGTG